MDATTQGNWKGIYGSDGYAVIGDSTNYPAYAQVAPSRERPMCGQRKPPIRAPCSAASPAGRIAATWYGSTSFTVDVNLTDGNPHRLALYNLDWDSTARAQRVDILDASSGSVLDSRSVTSFNGGQYLVWTLSGHVTIPLTMTADIQRGAERHLFRSLSATKPPQPRRCRVRPTRRRRVARSR